MDIPRGILCAEHDGLTELHMTTEIKASEQGNMENFAKLICKVHAPTYPVSCGH